MKNYRTHLDSLRQQAAESALISALATVPQKRELFAKLAAHLNTLAGGARNGGSGENFELTRRRSSAERLRLIKLLHHPAERLMSPV